MADKELEILSRLQDRLNLWTDEISQVRSFISVGDPVVGPKDATEKVIPVSSPPATESNLHAERMLNDSLLGDARKEIAHLNDTVQNLKEEVRTLRLDAVREEETRLALEQERDDARESAEEMGRQLLYSHTEYDRLDNERKEGQRETQLLRAELAYAREILLQRNDALRQFDAEYKNLVERREEAVRSVGQLRLHYDELQATHRQTLGLLRELQQHETTQEALHETLAQTEERLDAAVRALESEKEIRSQQQVALEKARFGQQVLQERFEEMARIRKKNSDEPDREVELGGLKNELTDLREQLELRANLEVALRAEIESLRAVGVEKDFVLNYMQQELDDKSAADVQEDDVVREALENTIRWREEVMHQLRESEELRDGMQGLRDSLTEKETELEDLKSRLDAASKHASGSNEEREFALREKELLLEIESLRADNLLNIQVLASLKKDLEPWLSMGDSLPAPVPAHHDEAKEEIDVPSHDEPNVFDGVQEVIDQHRETLGLSPEFESAPNAVPTTADVEEDDVSDALQINADIQERVEQFYARHRGSRMVQWGKVMAAGNAAALAFWGWAADFTVPTVAADITLFHAGFGLSALLVATGCGMVLAGLSGKR